MKFQTKVKFKKEVNQIDYQSRLLILGSCFAENIGEKLDYYKFQSLLNPFGILFHPLAIEKLISRAIKNETYTEKDIFFFNERWHCFDAHSSLSNISKERLLEQLNFGIENTYKQIISATHIIITLGTAWVYRKKKKNIIVANCHKVPQLEFSKELLAPKVIKSGLEQIITLVRSINKKVHFIFTVSPVRHLKDGFIENQRSKAHLITAIHDIISSQTTLKFFSYFPSYEIMIDELRDYRFYEVDMLHPNKLAIDYIWDFFLRAWIVSSIHSTVEEVDAVQKGIMHRPFNPNSEAHQRFLESLQKKIAYLKQKYPFMEF